MGEEREGINEEGLRGGGENFYVHDLASQGVVTSNMPTTATI